jgi:hypothetical protein
MKSDLIEKQAHYIQNLILDLDIKSIKLCRESLYIFEFINHQYLMIMLQKPLIGLIHEKYDPSILKFPASICHDFKKLIGKKIEGLIFNSSEYSLNLVFGKQTLVFPLKHKQSPYFAITSLRSIWGPVTSFNLKDSFETKNYLNKLKAYALKDLNAYESKIHRRIHYFQSRLIAIPKILEKENERLIFILENQKELLDRILPLEMLENYQIDRGVSIGVLVKKSYKIQKKLNQEMALLPSLIKAYEKKLNQPLPVKTVKNKQIQEEKKQSRIFKTTLGEIIKVAKSDKEADILTFKQASGNFFWFHIDQFKGAHVIIFHKDPSAEAIKKARFLAKYFSKAKDEAKADVVETQVKFLKKGKKPGEVVISKKKVTHVVHDPLLFNQLFSPLLP